MACADFFRRFRKSDVHNPSARRVFSQSIFINKSNQLLDLGFTNCLWKTYQISALYNFDYGEEKIKEYEQILEAFIDKEIFDKNSNVPAELRKLSVTITPLLSSVYMEGEQPSLKICIIDEKTPCFTGFLLSLGRKPGFMERSRKEAQAVVLPLFLADHSDEDEVLFIAVASFLKENFHSHVCPLKFSPSDLIWMLALSSFAQEKSGATILEYKLPLIEMSTIQYAINSINETCQKTLKPAFHEISEEQVQDFYSELLKHFHNLFSIKLAGVQLAAIKTPILRVQGDHSIIIFEGKYLFPILRHLTHLAQEIR